MLSSRVFYNYGKIANYYSGRKCIKFKFFWTQRTVPTRVGSYYEGKECKKFGFLWSKRGVRCRTETHWKFYQGDSKGLLYRYRSTSYTWKAPKMTPSAMKNTGPPRIPGEQTYCTFMFQSSSLFTWPVAVIWPALVNSKGSSKHLTFSPTKRGAPPTPCRFTPTNRKTNALTASKGKKKGNGKRLLSYALLASSSKAERW